ncbi:hypothetical protein BGW80DRAFT_1343513, partial [Lactifluus volemus]
GSWKSDIRSKADTASGTSSRVFKYGHDAARVQVIHWESESENCKRESKDSFHQHHCHRRKSHW